MDFRGPQRSLLLIWVLVVGSAPAAAAATELPTPGEAGWEPLRFRSIERPTRYAPLPEEAGVRAEARCGASALVYPLEHLDLAQTPVLRWRWRVDQALDIADERSKQGDDFAARVYVMFRFDADGASLIERARQRLGRTFYGREMPGSALNFVWSSRVAAGTSWTSPYTESTRLVALASGPGGEWRDEAVDVVAAYRGAFGKAPPPPLALGIMTDADDACQHAVARYADFRFTPAVP